MPASQIARDLGIDPNMLGCWCWEMDSIGSKVFQGQGKSRDEEMATLQKRVNSSQEGTGFLREASAFFALLLPASPEQGRRGAVKPGNRIRREAGIDPAPYNRHHCQAKHPNENRVPKDGQAGVAVDHNDGVGTGRRVYGPGE